MGHSLMTAVKDENKTNAQTSSLAPMHASYCPKHQIPSVQESFFHDVKCATAEKEKCDTSAKNRRGVDGFVCV